MNSKKEKAPEEGKSKEEQKPSDVAIHGKDEKKANNMA
jgi:hypothetical protein